MNEIENYIRNCKKQGKKIALTCGCFSILHPGHLEYFKLSKEICDILIVGLNSDDYILKNKNIKKILFKEKERLEIILSIKYVDNAFLFCDDNFSKYITKLKPDYFIKGVDYLNVINNEELEACNKTKTKILFLGNEKKYSSTEIIRNDGGKFD